MYLSGLVPEAIVINSSFNEFEKSVNQTTLRISRYRIGNINNSVKLII